MFDKVILETIKDFEGSSEVSPLRKRSWHAELTESGADDANWWFSVTMGTGISQFCFTVYPTMPTGCTGSLLCFSSLM